MVFSFFKRHFCMLFCLLFSNSSFAEVTHVSINSRQSELKQPLALKLNWVARNVALADVGFYFRQDSDSELHLVSVKKINNYLLQLEAPLVVNNPLAELLIIEYQQHGRHLRANLAIFKAPLSFNSANLSVDSAQYSVQTSQSQKKPNQPITAPSTEGACIISRDNNETLWKIANRYKEKWNTNIYGAILAIFETNIGAFSNKRIHLLRKDVPLSCPSNRILAGYNDKSADRKIFEMLQARHQKKPNQPITVASTEGACIISRDNNETLWKIANRYKEKWNTNIYGAILAIFETNIGAFSNKRIHLLRKDVPLSCPSNRILAGYNDKSADRKIFQILQARYQKR